MNDIYDRLEFARKQLGYSYAALGKILNISGDAVRKGIIDRKNLKPNYINVLINSLNISDQWLHTGLGDMLNEVLSINTNEYKKTVEDYKNIDGKFSETKRFPKEVIIITAKAGLNLQSNYYADELLDDLEKRVIYLDHDAKGRYFEIDSAGDSMNDGSIDSNANGDKLLLREIPKIYWKSKFHINKWDFTFFHYDKGFITKKIKEHNVETGDLLLESRNPDKDHYPDFWINLKECAIVCNVVEVRRQKGVYYSS